MTHILLLDNYDSFTYNVSQALGSLDKNIEVDVVRNDQISVSTVKERIRGKFQRGNQEAKPYDTIVVSPGPGAPADAGITMALIQSLGVSSEAGLDTWPGVPILGVCLGHQAIGEVFGGKVVRAPEPCHGKVAEIYHQNKGIFSGLPSPFKATRYHSLVVDWNTLPEEDLEVTAWTEDDLIMGLQHRKYPWIQGVQFHPESVLTKIEHRNKLFRNFLMLMDDSEPLESGWDIE